MIQKKAVAHLPSLERGAETRNSNKRQRQNLLFPPAGPHPGGGESVVYPSWNSPRRIFLWFSVNSNIDATGRFVKGFLDFFWGKSTTLESACCSGIDHLGILGSALRSRSYTARS
jgi:hypothetical protein